MNLRTLLNRFGRHCPSRLAFEWDHCGYQTGHKDMSHEVKKVLLCLDFSEEVLTYATKMKPDLILSHHPFFFGKPSEIRKADEKKKETEEKLLSELDCPLYSFHTSFDCCEGGMNDSVLDLLGFERIKVSDDNLMRFASLPHRMTMDELASHILSVYPEFSLGLLRGKKKEIQTIALIAGGASSCYPMAFLEGADCYISGDCPQHTRLDLSRYGYNYIELPHECEEKGFFFGMKRILESIDPELEILTYAYEKPFEVYSK